MVHSRQCRSSVCCCAKTMSCRIFGSLLPAPLDHVLDLYRALPDMTSLVASIVISGAP